MVSQMISPTLTGNTAEEKRIDSVDELKSLLKTTSDLSFYTFENVDMSGLDEDLQKCDVSGSLLLGCTLSLPLLGHFQRAEATILPKLGQRPYNPYRTKLYDAKELYENFDGDKPNSYKKTTDGLIYADWVASGSSRPTRTLDAIAQRIHDHSIGHAMANFLASRSEQKIVAVMAGHALPRSSDEFKKVALMSKRLSEMNYLVVSGGGPGGMEATHLGAWFSGRSETELTEAIAYLAKKAETYNTELWLSSAFEIQSKYPRTKETSVSLGIPTWHYGHEPSTPFATHIAKYFANSLREEGLVTVAKHGIIYATGSAGTIQEIFQDAAQNHYLNDKTASPMVLLGKAHWTSILPVNQLLTQLAQGRDYASLIGLVDTVEDVVQFLSSHPPIVKEK